MREFFNKLFSKLYFKIILCVLFLLFLYYYFLVNRIYFNVIDGSNIFVDVNSDFDISTVTACYGNRIFGCKSIDVTNTDFIDTSKIGRHKVKFVASYFDHKKGIKLNVNVVDREKPLISTSIDEVRVCPNNNDIDIPYTVSDNYDDDLSDKVLMDIYDDHLILSVYDSSFNLAKHSINIIREDNEVPNITLNGSSEIYLYLNDVFDDPFVTVSDNCDNNLDVKIDGNVDTSIAGDYTLIYSVSDGSGNYSSVQRIVHVIDTSSFDKVVYLTFDDGPSEYTSLLLDILKKYNVKATFFVTGRNSSYDYNIKRAFDEGHVIGLHTNSHNYNQIYSSVDNYFNDLNLIGSKVYALTGSNTNLIRFPGGSSNTVSRFSPGIMSSLSNLVLEKGYQYFDWNVSSGDASGYPLESQVYVENVINGISERQESIVLQHDTNLSSINAVSSIIEYGLSHGYRFDVLSSDGFVVHHKVNN